MRPIEPAILQEFAYDAPDLWGQAYLVCQVIHGMSGEEARHIADKAESKHGNEAKGRAEVDAVINDLWTTKQTTPAEGNQHMDKEMIEVITNPPKGEWMHPELATLFGEREAISDAEFNEWCARVGVKQTKIAFMLEELDENHPLAIAFDAGDPDLSQWNPERPAEGEWHLLYLVDHEDGPQACWYSV
jgi:hypothetical protein